MAKDNKSISLKGAKISRTKYMKKSNITESKLNYAFLLFTDEQKHQFWKQFPPKI
jgi:hypothetical protein